ncbi:MAG TPA: Mut7-C RNAse domain-containing protein [Terriglobales bacterium]
MSSGSEAMLPSSAERQVVFRFYAELNDFLPVHRRYTPFTHEIALPAAVKDPIESFGVPHTEIALILINSAPSEFASLVSGGDRVSVFPDFRTLKVNSLCRLRPPLQETRFVLDTHLGRLANYLRMLGFDSSYSNQRDDPELARISRDEERVLLTRDTGLLKRSAVVYGYFVRATEPREQVREVVRHFDLFSKAAPFMRCIACNSMLKTVSKQAVVDRLEPNTREYFDEFQVCLECDRVYWAGSHYKRMRRFVAQILAA